MCSLSVFFISLVFAVCFVGTGAGQQQNQQHPPPPSTSSSSLTASSSNSTLASNCIPVSITNTTSIDESTLRYRPYSFNSWTPLTDSVICDISSSTPCQLKLTKSRSTTTKSSIEGGVSLNLLFLITLSVKAGFEVSETYTVSTDVSDYLRPGNTGFLGYQPSWLEVTGLQRVTTVSVFKPADVSKGMCAETKREEVRFEPFRADLPMKGTVQTIYRHDGSMSSRGSSVVDQAVISDAVASVGGRQYNQIHSPSGKNVLTLNSNGVVSVSWKGKGTVWESPAPSIGSNIGPFSLIIQDDGNLAVFNKNYEAVWSTGLSDIVPDRRLGSFVLHVQNDGNVVIYNNETKYPVWSIGRCFDSGCCMSLEDCNIIL
ncbi:hypothetical protein GQ42DRAFT_163269 [Ramicandelaber brevisporus]|nr:hypothetical protein GQ42DRAFT_163269 [Ramicandelaber brevisporus]